MVKQLKPFLVTFVVVVVSLVIINRFFPDNLKSMIAGE